MFMTLSSFIEPLFEVALLNQLQREITMSKSNQDLAMLINEIEVINIKRSDASRLAEGFKDMSSKEKDESLTTRTTLKERYDDIVIELHDRFDIKLTMYSFIIKMREVA